MTRGLLTALVLINVQVIAAYQCILCTPGKYKSEIANNVCLECPYDTYLNYSGADDIRDCVNCPANMQSPYGTAAITGCVCNVGFYGPPGGPCAPCQTGAYADVPGQTACTFCPANQDSPLQSDEITDCACVMGYTGPNGGNCQQCPVSTYKTTTGNHSCTSCAVHTMTLVTGSNNSDACICTPGYSGRYYSNFARACGPDENWACGVTSSSEYGINRNYKINDGDLDAGNSGMTYAAKPAWFRIDFGKPRTVTGASFWLQYCNAGTSGPWEANWCYQTNNWYVAVTNSDMIVNILNDVSNWYDDQNICKSQISNGLANENQAVTNREVKVTCDTAYTGRYMYIYSYTPQQNFMGFSEVIPYGYDYSVCVGCVNGKFKPLPGPIPCTDCVVNTYSTATAAVANTTCLSCPANTVSASGSGVLTACKCDLGYTSPSGDGLACNACVQGKYKTVTGSQACTDCGYGKYSGAVAKTDAVCTDCLANENTNATGKNQRADCRCNPGYTGEDGTFCYACVPGKYKVTLGPEVCTLCAQDRYSTVTAATSGATCDACPTSSQSPRGSSAKAACICNMGYTGPGGSAAAPPAFIGVSPDMNVYCGLSWDANCNLALDKEALAVPGNISPNYRITDGNWPSTVSGDGLGLGPNPPLSEYSQYFTVNLGSTKTVTSGRFWATLPSGARGSVRIGNTAVVTDRTHSSWVHPSNLGTLCIDNLAGDVNFACISPIVGQYVYLISSTPEPWTVSDIILRGYNGAWYGYCNACVAGTFKPTNGSAVCTNCVADKYSTAVAAISNPCVDCPLFTQSVEGSGAITKCRCNAGYTGPDGVQCTGCVAGKYKTSVGTVLCSNCATDTFSTAVNKSDASCTTCVSVTTGPSQSLAGSALQTDCKCNMGYSGSNGSTCIACPRGAFKPSVGDATCSLCPTNTYQPALARTASVHCLECPEHALSLQASDELTDCECKSGYHGKNGSDCTQCYAGKFKPLQGPQDCTLCPNGTYSGVFAATSDGVCASCQANSLSWAGSTVLTDCHCDSGFFTENFGQPTVYCKNCGNGTYNTQLNATACSKCAAGLYSTSIGAKTGEVCQKCTSGFSGEGYAQCDSCPQHATALIASSFLTDCKCNPGYTGPDGGTCEDCAVGKFKPENGSIPCTNCPFDTYLPYTAASLENECVECAYNSITLQEGSDAVDDCKCNVGYTSLVAGFDGMGCTACAQGRYKNTTGHDPCALCPANTYLDATGSSLIGQCQQCFESSVSDEGSPTVESCKCIGGFQRYAT